MAAKKKKPNFPTHEKQEVILVTDQVKVGEHTTELVVKITVNCEKATFKIVSGVTTKQVHPINEEVRTSVAETVKLMIIAAMDKAMERRRFWLEQSGDEEQLELGFE